MDWVDGSVWEATLPRHQAVDLVLRGWSLPRRVHGRSPLITRITPHDHTEPALTPPPSHLTEYFVSLTWYHGHIFQVDLSLLRQFRKKGALRLHLSEKKNIAKGTTDTGVDCFNHINSKNQATFRLATSFTSQKSSCHCSNLDGDMLDKLWLGLVW